MLALIALETGLSSITIRNLEEGLKRRLRLRAAQHDRSMEEEARNILRAALASEPPKKGNLFKALRARIEPHGGVDLQLPSRDPPREPPRFE